MSHEKVFGFCENLCEREVEPKSRTENLYNPNLLVNCDDFSSTNAATIEGTMLTPFNVASNNMGYDGAGFEPMPAESSGNIEMQYQIAEPAALSADRLPMTLQVRFVARSGTGVTLKTYVFDETDDEFTETMGSVTWRITLTGYSVKIYWTKTANVQSEYWFGGAKLELGNVPTRFDISNTLGKTIDLVWTESKLRFEAKSNKVTSISSSSTDAQYPSARAVYGMLNRFEQKSNKVTGISSSSTDTQYPSAKAVYGMLNMLLGGSTSDWKNTPDATAMWYFYEEGTSTSTYDLPSENCIVIVFRKFASRGVAFAFGWAGTGTDKTIWKNTNHGGWHGWTPLHSN